MPQAAEVVSLLFDSQRYKQTAPGLQAGGLISFLSPGSEGAMLRDHVGEKATVLQPVKIVLGFFPSIQPTRLAAGLLWEWKH